MRTIYVTKAELFKILGSSALGMAMFMASGTQQGTALRILMDNVDRFDLLDPLVQSMLIPMLVQAGAFTQADVDKIQAYIDSIPG